MDVTSQFVMGVSRSSGIEQLLAENPQVPDRLVVNLDTDWLWSAEPTIPVPHVDEVILAFAGAYRTWQRALERAQAATVAAEVHADRWARERARLAAILDAQTSEATATFVAAIRTIWLDHVVCYLLHGYRAHLSADRGFDVATFVQRFPPAEHVYVRVRAHAGSKCALACAHPARAWHHARPADGVAPGPLMASRPAR